jgi:uncharacterized protein (TIGR04255 family)
MPDLERQQMEHMTDPHFGGSTEKCYPSSESSPIMVSGAMNQDLPSYKNPPVVETALSVQFQPIEGFKNAHLGLFWSQLQKQYPKVEDAEPIASQIELFGDQMERRPRLPHFQIGKSEAAARLRMRSDNDHAMVQIQNDRLVYNWRKMKEGEYPRWPKVLPQFMSALEELRTFLAAQGLDEFEPNQWEVTYVNHLPKGRNWDTPADWSALVPGLVGSPGLVPVVTPESLECKWKFLLPESSGRLHVDLFNGYTGPNPDSQEILVLQLTARGGIDPDIGRDVTDGLKIGHAAIVNTFHTLTGSKAHDRWGYQQ